MDTPDCNPDKLELSAEARQKLQRIAKLMNRSEEEVVIGIMYSCLEVKPNSGEPDLTGFIGAIRTALHPARTSPKATTVPRTQKR